MVQCKNSWFLFLTSWYSCSTILFFFFPFGGCFKRFLINWTHNLNSEVTYNCGKVSEPFEWNIKYFQHSSQGEIRPFHGFVLVTFSNASLWQPPIHEFRTDCFYTSSGHFLGGSNKPMKFLFFSFIITIYFLFFCCHLRRKTFEANLTPLFVWRSAATNWTRK